MPVIPPEHFRSLDLPTELQLLVIEQVLLEQRKSYNHENAYASVVRCDLSAAVAATKDGKKVVADKSFVKQKTSRCNDLLLVSRKMRDLYFRVAPTIAPLVLGMDLVDLLDCAPSDIANAWTAICDITSVKRVWLEISLHHLSQDPAWNPSGVAIGVFEALLEFTNLLLHVAALEELDVLHLLLEHGRIVNLDLITNHLRSHFDIFTHLCVPRLTRRRVFIARSCFGQERIELVRVHMDAFNRDGKYASCISPGCTDERWMNRHACSLTQERRMRPSAKLLEPPQTWTTSFEQRATAPAADMSGRECWYFLADRGIERANQSA